ncbi:MAG: xseA [Gammaproteobacteria bacterium]|jgi:exodeoxyribonuclease VII large subunit|nr:xseA [Gammaproteobacteria bacterium]
MTTLDISQANEIYSVSRLNREARLLLEENFLSIWVEGEISNFAAPQSGHWYFSLKEAAAQIRCAMFKPQNRRLAFIPEDGMHVIVKGRVSLYEGRGDFQLLVEHLEDAGIGKLQKEFEALKKRLLAAGLFDTAYKKKLPPFPQCIGIITSPTGAAIHDILHVLKRRFSCVPVIIYPTLVQGELAAVNIVNAIQIANQRQECDVIILARGGGSLEDLWSFNEEKVAYAIYHSTIPIISGIGHEIDFTIADFVADVRAPTPSAAAELVVPDKNELAISLNQLEKQMIRLLQQKLLQSQQHLDWITQKLQQQHPQRQLTEQAKQLNLAQSTLIRLQLQLFNETKRKLQTYHASLIGLTPRHRIRDLQHQCHLQQQRLKNHVLNELQQQQQSFITAAAKLDILSPLTTLKRGFSIATLVKENVILRSASQVTSGDKIKLQLSEGSVTCLIEEHRQ